MPTAKETFLKAKEAARKEQFVEITDNRVQLLTNLKELDDKDVVGSYRHTLERLVRDAGSDGISLALVKQVLPDPVILQQARNEIGTGSYVVGKGTLGEKEVEGEKLIVEGKGQFKGNTLTFYPGEKMKLESPVNNNPDTKVEAEG